MTNATTTETEFTTQVEQHASGRYWTFKVIHAKGVAGSGSAGTKEAAKESAVASLRFHASMLAAMRSGNLDTRGD
jgi:hypothetical protein